MRAPAPRVRDHLVRAAALALILVLGAGTSGAWAARALPPPHPTSTLEQIQPQSPATLVQGEDACAVLTDDEVLSATDGLSMIGRTPGPQEFMPAGCAWEVEIEGGFGVAAVYLGIFTQGGRRYYDTMVPFDNVGVPVPGVGEEAVDLGFGGLLAVEGDTVVSLSASGLAGSRPSSLVSRALGWVALRRLASAPVPLAGPALAGPGVLPTDQPSVDAVAAVRAGPFGDATVDATLDVLASAGIEVVDVETDAPLTEVSGEPSPLRLMDFQARSVALEAWAGNGILGSAIDTVLPVPDDAPLTSSVLAGWVAAVDTPNARMARALMAGQDVTDPTRLSFPTLAMLLFSDDIIDDTQASAAPAQATGRTAFLASAGSIAMPPLRTAQLDPCGAAKGFVDDVISTVFAVLKLPTPGNVVGAVVVGIWNWLVSRGEDFVRAAVQELTAPVIGFIRTVAGAIALVGSFVSVTQVYTLVVSPSHANIVLPVAPAPAVEGFFQAIVTTSLPDWPAVLVGCANAAGVPLPSLTAKGSPVTWGPLGFEPPPLRALLTDQAIDTALDQEETPTALRRFITTTETEDEAQGDEHVSHVTVEARVVRQDIRRAFEDLKNALFGGVPEIIRVRVRGELEPHVDGILDRVGGLLDVRAPGELVIIYHTEKPDPTDPPPSIQPDGLPDTGAAGGAVWVRIDRNELIQRQGAAIPDATVVPDIAIIELFSCSGPYGPWDGVLRTGAIEHPSGQHTIVEVVEIPVAFSFPGRTGEQEALISGTVGTPIAWVPTFIDIVDMDYHMGVSVDGSSMTLEGGIGSGGPVVLPITPAPPGSCPRPGS